jgi:hypothetical protein
VFNEKTASIFSTKFKHEATPEKSILSVAFGSGAAAHRKFPGVRFRAEENPIFGLKRDTYQYPDSFRALAPQN